MPSGLLSRRLPVSAFPEFSVHGTVVHHIHILCFTDKYFHKLYFTLDGHLGYFLVLGVEDNAVVMFSIWPFCAYIGGFIFRNRTTDSGAIHFFFFLVTVLLRCNLLTIHGDMHFCLILNSPMLVFVFK